MIKFYFIFFFFVTLSFHSKAQINMPDREIEIEEVHIIPKSQKQRGKEIMKEVIKKRPFFNEKLAEYSCETYCFSTVDEEIKDSIIQYVQQTKRANQLEWSATSFYKKDENYKDIFHGFMDLSLNTQILEKDNLDPHFKVNFEGGESVINNVYILSNPNLFINSSKDADVNLFRNQIHLPNICERPIISPLANNALLFYNFYLEETNANRIDSIVYKIKVEPIYQHEALFSGYIYIRNTTWELLDYDLLINPSALFNHISMQIKGSYRKQEDYLIPTYRSFDYFFKKKNQWDVLAIGTTKITYEKFQLLKEKKNQVFWEEAQEYDSTAYDKDSTFWNSVRKFKLNANDLKYIHEQDSIKKKRASKAYIHEKDSIYNAIKFWDFIVFGVGFRNTFKQQELSFSPLIAQIVPAGVGGYRHRLSLNYAKGFKNGQRITIEPSLEYGFLNNDLKGELGGSFLYNPKKSSTFSARTGDVYDFINTYQSILGTWGPGNRVRNKKIELSHRFEITNGLYLLSEFLYSNRIAITDMKFPGYVSLFGNFSKPQPFDNYKVSMLNLEFEYHYRQKFKLYKNRKIILDSKWPILAVKIKSGIPNLFGGQSNFQYLELRLSHRTKIRTFGELNYRFNVGQFVYKKDLRIIEHRYFRASDITFFSNPTNTMQLLDTNMNTANGYAQFNVIHHFNGYFLNKIWGINKLRLEEAIGGGILTLPTVHYFHAELFVGLERQFKMFNQPMKIGVYCVSAKSNTHLNYTNSIKIGFNIYDTFRSKWFY